MATIQGYARHGLEALQAGDIANAVKSYMRAVASARLVKNFQLQAMLYTGLAEVRYATGDTEGALHDALAAVAIDPADQAGARKTLAALEADVKAQETALARAEHVQTIKARQAKLEAEVRPKWNPNTSQAALAEFSALTTNSSATEEPLQRKDANYPSGPGASQASQAYDTELSALREQILVATRGPKLPRVPSHIVPKPPPKPSDRPRAKGGPRDVRLTEMASKWADKESRPDTHKFTPRMWDAIRRKIKWTEKRTAKMNMAIEKIREGLPEEVGELIAKSTTTASDLPVPPNSVAKECNDAELSKQDKKRMHARQTSSTDQVSEQLQYDLCSEAADAQTPSGFTPTGEMLMSPAAGDSILAHELLGSDSSDDLEEAEDDMIETSVSQQTYQQNRADGLSNNAQIEQRRQMQPEPDDILKLVADSEGRLGKLSQSTEEYQRLLSHHETVRQQQSELPQKLSPSTTASASAGINPDSIEERIEQLCKASDQRRTAGQDAAAKLLQTAARGWFARRLVRQLAEEAWIQTAANGQAQEDLAGAESSLPPLAEAEPSEVVAQGGETVSADQAA
eukprot:SAG31_NODE_2000_length_6694_cov_13.828658_1_plen_570_part_10